LASGAVYGLLADTRKASLDQVEWPAAPAEGALSRFVGRFCCMIVRPLKRDEIWLNRHRALAA
jgi:hypothetical protein